MSIENVMEEKLAPLTERMEALKEELKTEFQAVFKEQAAILFEKYDWLKELSWTQYTPYFNDGDSCEFYVNDEVSINGCNIYGDKVYAESWSSVLFDESEAEEFAETVKDERREEFRQVELVAGQLVGFLASNDEIALMMFGDHAKVSIQRDGVYVEECEHD